MSVLLSIRADLTGPEIAITSTNVWISYVLIPKARDMHRVLYSKS